MATLHGRHAVITGGGSGIGLAIAERLQAEGARLTLMGRTRERLERANGLLPRGEVHILPCDVTDADQVAAAFDAAQKAAPVDVLINNAGAAEAAPFLKTSPELWQHMLNVNLTGAYLCTRAVLAHLRDADFGRIVNIASTAGIKGYAYASAYVAAKHGLVGLTRALALEFARTAVTVNAVCPGYTETDLIKRSVAQITEKTGRSREEAIRELQRANPQGRLTQPSEVAEAVAWLCALESRGITGQAIVVAGGEVMG